MLIKEGPWYKRIDWVNALFLASAHIVAFGGTWLLVQMNAIQIPTLFFFLFMQVITGVAITGGYHRLFAHKSYQGGKFLKLIYLLFGAAAFQNSAVKWSSDHRRHHMFVDTDRDPYNIKEGFLFAHIGWVLMKYEEAHRYDDVPDLEKDPLVKFQNDHYLSLAIGMGLLFPTLVASLWGDPLGGFFFAGWLRIVVNEHFTFSINSFSHMFGKQPYSDQDTSRDNWFFAFFSFGEGYHNYHHKFPFDYRNGIKFHQWDPTKWLIRFLTWVGQTKNLKRAPKEMILKARLKMDEKRLIERLDKLAHPARNISAEIIVSARLKFEQAYANFKTLKGEIGHLKKQKIDAMADGLNSLNAKIKELKRRLPEARLALQEATATWTKLRRGLEYSS